MSVATDLVTISDKSSFDENGVAYLSSDKISIVGVGTELSTVWNSTYITTIEYNQDMNYISDTLMMTGTYTGDGNINKDNSQFIPTELTPKAVLVVRFGTEIMDYGDGTGSGGLAITGVPAKYVDTKTVSVDEGIGFVVYNSADGNAKANELGEIYTYIAWF